MGSGMRVLYLKNVQDAAQWVRNTYISFEASPVSVLFGGIGEDTTSGQVWELVQASHAGYLYADETDEALKRSVCALYRGICVENVVSNSNKRRDADIGKGGRKPTGTAIKGIKRRWITPE